jgi:hypothetical protein
MARLARRFSEKSRTLFQIGRMTANLQMDREERMLHSAEVRWFDTGAIPTAVQAWFCGGLTLTPEIRTDRYLRFEGCETVGVKIRQGNFEIKALRGATESVRYADVVTGRADCWVKWSYSQPPVEAWVQALLEDSRGWVEIGKTRLLRKFSLERGAVEEVAATQRPQEGCNFELTEIRSGRGLWWSLALEAFGDPSRVRENLRQTAVTLFAQSPPPLALDTTRSCAYPVFLNAL